MRDTGPGIAPAEQARIFERYYQSPQAQAQGGTGLGLALSRDLAALLGGSLTLVSEPGQGAAFTFRFPAQAVLPTLSEVLPEERAGVVPPTSPLPARQNEPLAGHPLRGAEGGRVLVVEDQPDLRDYLRALLAPTCEVLVAADGQEALEVLGRKAPIDLLITDAKLALVKSLVQKSHLAR